MTTARFCEPGFFCFCGSPPFMSKVVVFAARVHEVLLNQLFLGVIPFAADSTAPQIGRALCV